VTGVRATRQNKQNRVTGWSETVKTYCQWLANLVVSRTIQSNHSLNKQQTYVRIYPRCKQASSYDVLLTNILQTRINSKIMMMRMIINN